MDPAKDLISQGGFGLIAGIFLWLYLGERKDHKETRKTVDALMEARLQDAKETTNNATRPLEELAQNTKLIYDKLLSSKRGR